MTKSEVCVDWKELQKFTSEMFVKQGCSAEDAETEAEVLVWANLRGIDSHGVLRIPEYVKTIAAGEMNPKPNINVVKETAATVLIDGDFALGPVVTTQVMRMVMKKAGEVGIGWGLIRNTTHQGAMGYYSLMAATEGMAGIAIVCSQPNMAPHGARTKGVHNSPITIAVPAKRHSPPVIDMATSVAAGGKITLAVDKGISVPQGWILDQDGNPTTDPNQYAMLLPSGGPKGSGLAMMFECLTSLMATNSLLAPVLLENKHFGRYVQNSVVAAVDVGTFTDLEDYKEHVDNLIDAIKGLPPADGVDEIFVPGEPEIRIYRDRIRNGIPLPEGTVRNLRAVAEEFDVSLPFGM